MVQYINDITADEDKLWMNSPVLRNTNLRFNPLSEDSSSRIDRFSAERDGWLGGFSTLTLRILRNCWWKRQAGSAARWSTGSQVGEGFRCLNPNTIAFVCLPNKTRLLTRRFINGVIPYHYLLPQKLNDYPMLIQIFISLYIFNFNLFFIYKIKIFDNMTMIYTFCISRHFFICHVHLYKWNWL